LVELFFIFSLSSKPNFFNFPSISCFSEVKLREKEAQETVHVLLSCWVLGLLAHVSGLDGDC